MVNKTIWPDYDLGYDDVRAGLQTHVRKQAPDGMWHIIPVMMHYEFTRFPDRDFAEDAEQDSIKHTAELLDFIKRFNVECYKVLLFWQFPATPLTSSDGRVIGAIIADNQESEKERLLPHLKIVRDGE